MAEEEQNTSEEPKANDWVDRRIQTTENLEAKAGKPEVKEDEE